MAKQYFTRFVLIANKAGAGIPCRLGVFLDGLGVVDWIHLVTSNGPTWTRERIASQGDARANLLGEISRCSRGFGKVSAPRNRSDQQQ